MNDHDLAKIERIKLVKDVAEAIHKARHTPDGIPYRPLDECGQSDNDYARRLARGVLEVPAISGAAERGSLATLYESDLHYLGCIKRRLTEFKEALADTAAFSLAGQAFADELDWLDCFIDQHERRRNRRVAA